MKRIARPQHALFNLFALFAILLASWALPRSAEADVIRPSDRFRAGDDGEVIRIPARVIEMRGDLPEGLSAPTVCPDSFDVQHYELHLNPLRGTSTLEGTAIVTIESTIDGLAGVQLDLRMLTVSSVTRAGNALVFAQAGDIMTISLDTTYDTGSTFDVEIVYSGTPDTESGGFGGFWFFPFPITDFSMGVGLNANPPSMGRYWFPGVDAPCDKATCDIYVETSGPKTAVSNGLLQSVVTDTITGRKTYHWQETHQIATYLMSISVAKYTAIPDTANPLITYYVHNNLVPQAAGTFANVPAMMATFESLFGPYPYDKFSYVTTPIGDMEHQTCVSHSTALMSGTTANDDILAHELMHQWFGDLVTYDDWREVWLSEGFATYGEALFVEAQSGAAPYRNYVTNQLMAPYLVNAGILTYPIYDPTFKWGTVVYEKGGVVLHMLRKVLGDTAFFAAMNGYLTNHAFSSAVTGDFQAACEAEYGSSLAWFFNEWIYQGGHPIIDWTWSSMPNGPNYDVSLGIVQSQTVGPAVYEMPVDFKILGAGTDTTVTVWMNAATQTFPVTVPFQPTSVQFDPLNWLLDEAALVPTGVADGTPAVPAALESNRPNPFNPLTAIPFHLPAAARVSITIHDPAGRLVRTLLDAEPIASGSHLVPWDGVSDAGESVASGVYFYRMLAGETIETRKMHLVR